MSFAAQALYRLHNSQHAQRRHDLRQALIVFNLNIELKVKEIRRPVAHKYVHDVTGRIGNCLTDGRQRAAFIPRRALGSV